MASYRQRRVRAIFRGALKFKMHRDSRPVEIRSGREMIAGKKYGGVALGRRHFLGQIEPLEAEMYRINEAMALHPLTGKDKEGKNTGYCFARRIFGSGSLSVGGRLYGDWQQLKQHERLRLKIDDDAVCEIDVKACFLSIAFAKHGNGQTLPTDPYSEVPFVKYCADPEKQRELRAACKRLVVSYLCKKGELSRFPTGEKKDRQGELISFKKQYGLTKKVQFFMSQIKKAFPFLEQQKQHGGDLMNVESNIIGHLDF